MTVKRSVPLEIDWDNSVKGYDVIEVGIKIIPEELDVFMHEEIRKRSDTGI